MTNAAPMTKPAVVVLTVDALETCKHVKRSKRSTFPTPPVRCGKRAKYCIDGVYLCCKHSEGQR